jgi:hypothetical protein
VQGRELQLQPEQARDVFAPWRGVEVVVIGNYCLAELVIR